MPKTSRIKSRKLPSYLTVNRYGIYSFQFRIPTALLSANTLHTGSRIDRPTDRFPLFKPLNPLIRFTLQTRDHSVAVRKVRQKMTVLDTIQETFNGDASSAGRAIQLWIKYEAAASNENGFTSVDNFLSELDRGDRHLLSMVLRLDDKETEQNKLREENALLKSKLLEKNNSINNHFDRNNMLSTSTDDIALQEVYEKFIDAKVSNDSAKSSVEAYKTAASRFVEIVCYLGGSQDRMVSSLCANDVRKYVTLMSKLPQNLNSNGLKTKMDLAGFINLVDGKSKSEIEGMGYKPLAGTTLKGRFTIVREFIRYIEGQCYPIQRGLDAIIKLSGRSGKKGIVNRRRYNEVELKNIFQSEKYRLCKFKRASEYWAPLLALFTGGTQSELIQLHVEDIYEKDGAWVIDINDKADKRLKNRDGRIRITPIHNILVKLGFIKFVNSCKNNNQARLFPDEARNERDQFSGYSKRFNTFRKKCGVGIEDSDKVDFHSFRHTVSTILIGMGVATGVANDIVGHASSQRTETERTYSEGAFISVKVDALKKLKYDIDFNYPKLWVKKYDSATEKWV
jgi:integrase